jgi:outer membrane protein assembly factor BamB
VLGDDSIFVVYTGSADITGGVISLSRTTGEIRWSGTFGGNPGAAPALGDLLVVPGRNGELVGLDPSHGGVRWETPGYGGFTIQPALTEGTAYAGNADGRIHRVDLHDGGEAWAVELGATVTGDPVIVDGHLIVGLTDGRLVCLK